MSSKYSDELWVISKSIYIVNNTNYMYIFKNISELCTICCSDPARKAKFCHPTTYLRRNETRSPK